MNRQRPVNLSLGTLRFPPMAIASILHRISGVGLFLMTPFLICLLSCSLASEASFGEVRLWLQMPVWKLLLWAFGTAFAYHVLAGIRHLIMDFGHWESVEAGRRTAITVIVLAVIAALLLGVWIW